MQDECDKVAQAEAGKIVSSFVISGSECTKDFLLQELNRLRAENAELKDRLGEVSDPECRLWEITYSYESSSKSPRSIDAVRLYAYSKDMAKKFLVNQVSVLASVINTAVRWPRHNIRIESIKEAAE